MNARKFTRALARPLTLLSLAVLTFAAAAQECPCTIWPSTATPAVASASDTDAVNLGVKFRSDVSGVISGIRFYKGSANTGTHVGNLWTSSGQLLASAIFTNETASGWQQVNFASPVAIDADTVYIASYHAPNGGYAVDANYFASGFDRGGLHALQNGISGGNGVFVYGPASVFPNSTFGASNYWVDVVFTPVVDTTPPAVTGRSPVNAATGISTGASVTATFGEALDPATVSSSTFELRNTANALVPATVTWNAATRTATLVPSAPLAGLSTHTVTIRGGAADPRVKDLAGNALAANAVWSFTTAAGDGCPCSIWPSTATPAVASFSDAGAVNLGLKFRADVSGVVTGIRFYKGSLNTGTHVGNLWTSSGQLLASATFTSETASGWQQVNFASPVAIDADTVYIASYHAPNGGYAVDANYFASGFDRGGLHALQNGISGGNGVAAYGAASVFPNSTFGANNYWVDVVFTEVVDIMPPEVTGRSPVNGATGVGFRPNVAVTFSEKLDPATVSSSTFELRNGANVLVPATVSWDAATRTATLVPNAPLADLNTHTVTLRGGSVDPRVKDLAGNALAANAVWSFTTAGCPCTIWPSTATPAVASDSDIGAVTLGVKFRSDVSGFVTGIRFYKGSANTGTHVGNLWTSSGQLLASAIFTNETASGWQQVSFASPVAIDANTVYVASYHAPNGRYAVDANYFALGFDGGGVHALPNAASGGNGVYVYGPVSAFPNTTFGANNYWVDVVFYGGGYVDTTVPTVTIDAPTSASTFSTITSSLNLAGTAADTFGVSQVSWSNNRGGSGLAAGTTSWSISGIPLQPGTNVLTVTAKDPSGNAGARALAVTYTPETIAPTVNITVPTSAATFITDKSLLNLAGIAADNIAVTQVTWSNNRGGSGVASGTDFWSASRIPLLLGSNVITVTARDAVGNSATATLTVTSVPDTTVPIVSGHSPASGAAGLTIGTAVIATFSEELNPATVGSTTFELRNASNVLVPATVSWNAETSAAMLVPSGPLAPSTTYTATIRGGTTDPRIKDLAGNALATDVTWSFTTAAPGCATNAITAENCLAGSPPGEWEISGFGDPTIQGFATDISVNRGGTVFFKVETDASNYHFDIYRLGYYGGNGARKAATVQPSGAPQGNQPSCLTEPSTGLIDCGNWQVSGSWTVPADAVSGIYLARVVRDDTDGASHIVFVVRDDASTSDIIFQTSDTTWQAYNDYGGNSLYTGAPAGRAFKVSYNRPFATAGNQFSNAWFLSNEYPMVRWLEANGYDLTYAAGVDSDRAGSRIRNHRTYLSVGHDEYWSSAQRANVEAARNAGVHLGFFSGNLMFWKTRWENSMDGSSTPYRTLISYKETHANAKIDPSGIWTGTWRDARFSPPADGGRPENALIGTIFTVNCCREDAIKVPEALGKFRFWRNTTVATQAPGETATVGQAIVGYEWDEDLDNGFRPAGLFRLSSNAISVGSYLLDNGSTFGNGTGTHSLTLYRHSSGALVFAAGTIQWSWGLDDTHGISRASAIPPPDISIQQVTVNLLADMGVQPATLRAGLAPAFASTDTVAPTSTVTSPIAGSKFEQGTFLTIAGTAQDSGGGLVAGVEVSVDGGATWQRANGRESWTYDWTVSTQGSVTIKTRAVDDSGNLEVPGVGTTFTSLPCACISIWPSTATPAVASYSDPGAVNLGVKFRSDVSGVVSGIRFYKGSANTGTHVGSLWTSSGQLLASATFTNETASGWQQVNFASPVAIDANTVYVASYHAPRGGYAVDANYFASGSDHGVLHALQNGLSGGNGVAAYGAASVFPNSSFGPHNYWVDVVFTERFIPDTTPPVMTGRSPVNGTRGISTGASVTATFSEALDPATVSSTTFELRDGANALVPVTVSWNAATRTATLTPNAPLAGLNTHTVTLRGGSADPRLKDLAGNALAANAVWSFTTAAGDGCPCSIWPSTATPAIASQPDNAVNLGVKFRSDVSGVVSGIRFYKGSANTGTHVGSLWTSSGQLLGSATFANETASGWQQVNFASPVAIDANTVYVASYHAPRGGYAADLNYFASGFDRGVLHALQNGVSGGNGVAAYGAASAFPNTTFGAHNYWVDVVFTEATVVDTTPPEVTGRSPANGATGTSTSASVTVTFSEALDPATVSSSTFELRNAANVLVPATVSWNSATLTATLVPSAPLAGLSTHTVTLRGGAVDPRVKDPAGNALAANAVWSFTTGVPNVLPSVTLTSPVAGARFTAPAAVSLAASAADTDGTITKVEFYRGTTLVGEGTAAPYRATDTGVAVGTYSYTARAYDSNGGVATSAAVTVTVSPPPTPVIYLYDELGRLIGVEH